MSTNKWTAEQKAAAVTEWRSGVPFAAVMKKYKILGTGALSAWARKIDAAAPKSAPKPAPNAVRSQRSYTPEERASVLASIEGGMPIIAAAKMHGISVGNVYAWRANAKKRQERQERQVVVAVPQPEQHGKNGMHVSLVASATASRDAMIFLKKAKGELLAGLRSGAIHDFDNVHLMSMLALNSLTGGKS